MIKGVLDRTENGKAVILIENKQEEWIIPVTELPPGSKTGTWFELTDQNGHYHIIRIDKETTKEKAMTTQDIMAQLKAKKKTSTFRRK